MQPVILHEVCSMRCQGFPLLLSSSFGVINFVQLSSYLHSNRSEKVAVTSEVTFVFPVYCIPQHAISGKGIELMWASQFQCLLGNLRFVPYTFQ